MDHTLTTTNAARGLNVAVIGGSLAGCAAAAELTRVGCEVTVFERSNGSMYDRGAGLSLAPQLVERMRERGLVGPDWPLLSRDKRSYMVRTADETGRIIWEQPVQAVSTRWGLVYHQLRSRVPASTYRAGHEVASLRQTSGGAVEVGLAGGRNLEFDLVVCADGYQSLGRSLLFPDLKLDYGGYIAWRGLVAEALAEGVIPHDSLGGSAVMSERGHAIFYLVPGPNGETEPGRRLLNWVWYENVATEELAASLGTVTATSVAPGGVPDERVAHLRSEGRRLFWPAIADVFDATERPFIQAIYDLHAEHYRLGRVCLVGDAATVARPHAGIGAQKAISNAMALADALSTSESVDAALSTWDEQQSALGARILALAQAMGRWMQSEDTDWFHMESNEMETWLATVAGQARGLTGGDPQGR